MTLKKQYKSIHYYYTGYRETETSYLNGKQHGLYKKWWDNGQLKLKCMYVNNKKHGLYEKWHENGQLKEECTYVSDKEHDLLKEWYNNGQLKKECTYNNGKKYGLYKIWSRNNILMLEEYYYNCIRYPTFLLPILQRKVKAKILLRKFKSLIQTEGFQQAWMDPTCFGGYWHKQRFLKDLLSM